MAPLIDRDKREQARRSMTERRRAIVEAARQVFVDRPYGEASLAGIGRAAGVPDGTAELLFATREQLFLEVLADALNACSADLVRELRLFAALDAPALASVMARVVARHETATRLLSQLAPALESVSDPTVVWHLSNRVRDGLVAVRAEILDRCPELGPGRLRMLFPWLFVLATGLEPLAHAKSGVAAALIDPALRDYAVDFETELRSMLAGLLR